MKPGHSKIDLKARIESIVNIIKELKIVDAITISQILNLTVQYIARLLRNYIPDINVYKINKYGVGRPIYLYYFGKLNEEKTNLINKMFRIESHWEW